jgi:transmembrane sensor
MNETDAWMERDAIEEQAIAWHLKLRDADADANAGVWDEFMMWLDADSRHNQVYDRVLVAEQDIDAALPALPVVVAVAANENDDGGKGGRWRWMGAGAGLAAAAAIAVFFSGTGRSHPEPYEIATGLGQQRIVTLAGGSQIALNGSSTVVLDHRNPRLAELRSGEASFTVIHDDKAPFTVSVGNRRIEDVGTVFNVVADGKAVTVDVKEGSVRYTSGANAVSLMRGQSLTETGGGDPIILSNRPVSAIASWQTGRLEYEMQSLGTVARDISRYLGVPITLDASLAGKQFSGTIQIDRDRTRFFARLGRLLGVKARPNDNGWTLSAQ